MICNKTLLVCEQACVLVRCEQQYSENELASDNFKLARWEKVEFFTFSPETPNGFYLINVVNFRRFNP